MFKENDIDGLKIEAGGSGMHQACDRSPCYKCERKLLKNSYEKDETIGERIRTALLKYKINQKDRKAGKQGLRTQIMNQAILLGKLVTPLLSQVFSQKNIKRGFYDAGIYPYSEDRIFSKLRRELTSEETKKLKAALIEVNSAPWKYFKLTEAEMDRFEIPKTNEQILQEMKTSHKQLDDLALHRQRVIIWTHSTFAERLKEVEREENLRKEEAEFSKNEKLEKKETERKGS